MFAMRANGEKEGLSEDRPIFLPVERRDFTCLLRAIDPLYVRFLLAAYATNTLAIAKTIHH